MHVVLGGGAGGGKRRGKHGEYTGSGWQECVGKRNDFLEKGTREPARMSVVDLCVTACSPAHCGHILPPHPARNGVFWEIGEKGRNGPEIPRRRSTGCTHGTPILPQRTDATETGGVIGETESRSGGAQFGMEGEALMPNETALARCWGRGGREVCYFPNECDQAIQDGDWGVPSSSYPLFIKTQMDTLTRVPPSTPPRLITRARIRSKRNNSPSSKERLGKGGDFFSPLLGS